MCQAYFSAPQKPTAGGALLLTWKFRKFGLLSPPVRIGVWRLVSGEPVRGSGEKRVEDEGAGMKNVMKAAAAVVLMLSPAVALADDGVEARVSAHQAQMVSWRRDFHQHPELSNREVRTAGIVAGHLRSLGLEVETGIAGTGVLGVLKGEKPGPVIALRADMDALPILEQTGLPFASTVRAEYAGSEVPVMHACGHDAHTAILMGAASILAEMKAELAGTVLFVFQPAEEGPPPGETGGAPRMLAEGVFETYQPEAMFALHVEPGPMGRIYTRPDGFLAGASSLKISLSGEGTHAAKPWSGSDLPSLGADIIKALGTIAARRIDVLEEPSVISIGKVEIGTRLNILPADGVLEGTVRTYSAGRLAQVKEEIERAVTSLAQIYGAQANVTYTNEIPATENNAALMARIAPVLEQVAGEAGLDTNALRRPAAEDFSHFARQIPSVYFILGSTPDFTTMAEAPANHSPHFDIDEAVLAVGAEAFVRIALDYPQTN